LYLQKGTGRLECALCRCGVLGGHRAPCLTEQGAVGACSGLIPAGRIPRTILGRELSAVLLAGLVENLGEALPDRLTRFRRKLLGKRPQFLVLVGGGVERFARLC